jgi:hypothetical protein
MGEREPGPTDGHGRCPPAKPDSIKSIRNIRGNRRRPEPRAFLRLLRIEFGDRGLASRGPASHERADQPPTKPTEHLVLPMLDGSVGFVGPWPRRIERNSSRSRRSRALAKDRKSGEIGSGLSPYASFTSEAERGRKACPRRITVSRTPRDFRVRRRPGTVDDVERSAGGRTEIRPRQMRQRSAGIIRNIRRNDAAASSA